MNKKEKYIKYIVGDLVKKTEIDYDQEKIKYPFSLYLISLFSPITPSSFRNYLKERYGAHSEEIEIIWNQYREKILTIIGNG
tara:strand:+ start:1430 stop:1675 length:246 start_codon:yes stop_codon:yes gene_type:complete